MTEMNVAQQNARRKRVNRLKKIILSAVFLAIAVPVAVCIFLAIRVGTMEDALEKLQQQVDQYANQLAQLESAKESLEQELLQKDVQLEKDSQQTNGAEDQEQTDREEAEEAEPVADHLRRVYLTFDDGPSSHTDEILDILNQYQVKATFFVVGKESEESKERLKRIVEEGHTLGMHSYSHVYDDIYTSLDNFDTDFHKLQDYLYEVTGVMSTVYRFPGGSSNKVSQLDMQEFIRYLSDQGVAYFDWNISSGDASPQKLSANSILENCTKDLTKHKNAVILMHDAAGKSTTVEALPMIIEKILAMEDTVLLPITEDTAPVQHITKKEETED